MSARNIDFTTTLHNRCSVQLFPWLPDSFFYGMSEQLMRWIVIRDVHGLRGEVTVAGVSFQQAPLLQVVAYVVDDSMRCDKICVAIASAGDR